MVGNPRPADYTFHPQGEPMSVAGPCRDQETAAPNSQEDAPMVSLSDKAAAKVNEIRGDEGIEEGDALRLRVVGGGCSGFSYDLYFDQPAEVDRAFEIQGVKFIVDEMSLMYLVGTEIDYVEGLQGAGFKFNNPNVKSTCGCGSLVQPSEQRQARLDRILGSSRSVELLTRELGSSRVAPRPRAARDLRARRSPAAGFYPPECAVLCAIARAGRRRAAICAEHNVPSRRAARAAG